MRMIINPQTVVSPSFAELPKAPTTLFSSDITATSVQLRWKKSPTEDVESYTIIVSKKDSVSGLEESLRQIPNIEAPKDPGVDVVHYKLKNLQPSTTYLIQVMAVGRIGHSEKSKPALVVKTKELRKLSNFRGQEARSWRRRSSRDRRRLHLTLCSIHLDSSS